MTDRILLLTSHSIAEYDDLRMFVDLGYDVFSIGAYSDPAHPTDDKRPALPDAPAHPDLVALCERQRERHAGERTDHVIDWAKGDLADELLDWAEVIIVHHFPIPWIVEQWPRLRGRRVIWRTCGQSTPDLERVMAPLHDEGLQVVRYAESERALATVGPWAGSDALIHFGKYPDDYPHWIGDEAIVGNVTQDMVGRGEACGLSYYLAATEGLPARPAGPRSERLPGGIGALPYPALLDYLTHIGVYLYTGTVPAPYTLGLLEAMLVGVPIVTMPAHLWCPALPDLWGGHWMGRCPSGPLTAREYLAEWLAEGERSLLSIYSDGIRASAASSFGVRSVGPQWRFFLDTGRAATLTEQMAFGTVAA